MIRALKTFDELHLNRNAQFDPLLFEQAQRQVLVRRGLRLGSFSDVEPQKQCIRTLLQLENVAEKSEFENIAVELIDAYARLRDPHSYALSNSDRANRSSYYNGYGFAIERSNLADRVEVVEVIAGSPAHSAGLQKGMAIGTINGVDVALKSMNQVAMLINNAANETVVLSVSGPSVAVTRQVTLKRSRFKIAPVKSATFEKGRIAYLKLRTFTDAEASFAENLQSFSSATILILDLRDLPGGSVESALDLADWITPGKRPFVGFLARDMSSLKPLSLQDPNSIWDGAVVVLVNSGTMSAAEILAGALQDYGAVVVGSTTFGKGTRQKREFLSDFGLAGDVHVTDAFTIRPSGKVLQFQGVKPDVMLPTFKKNEGAREIHDARALPAPLDQLPLPGYDPSLLLMRAPAFRSRLAALEKQLTTAIELGQLGLTEEDQHLEGAKQVAQFLNLQIGN